jgi:DNA-binding response OmpR family regulator
MAQTVLLVDDEPQLLYSLNEYLAQAGYNVLAAASGSKALDVLVDEPPDFIISDIMMDDMDGFEFQRRVISLTGDSIPFIFLTAKDDLHDRITGLRNGADDYITKPFDPEELEARLVSIMHRIEQTRREERRETENLRDRIVSELASRLRSPVTNLMAHLNLLLTERFGEDDAGKRRYLQSALQDANALVRLIEDLSWSNLDDGSQTMAIKREPIRVAPVVRRASANAARLACEQGIELRITCGGLLSGNIDGDAIAGALAALLKSAVDFSAPGSRVEITARRAEEGGLEFIIQDGGRTAYTDGDISQELVDALDLARRVVKAHGGQLSIERLEDGEQRLIIWVPGRVAKHVGRRPR